MTQVRVDLSAAALRDAARIADFLAKEAGQRVAFRFAAQLEHLIAALRSMPRQGRETTRRGTYVMLMRPFPYHVIYREIGPDQSRIVRIRHARRRPLTWL